MNVALEPVQHPTLCTGQERHLIERSMVGSVRIDLYQ